MYIYSLVPLFTLCLYSSASPISSSQIDSDLISIIGSTPYAQSTPEPTPWSYTPPPPIHPSTDGTCGPSNNSVCDREGKAPCCSQFGWCGKGPQWCGVGCQDEFGRCDENTSPEVKGVSLDGSCGGEKGWTCNGSSSGPCCSSYGWCGTSDDHCGLGCQSLFGNCSPVVSSSLPSLPSISVPSSPVETIVSSFAALPSTGIVTNAGDTIVLVTSTVVVSPIPATETGDFSPILSPSSLSKFTFSPEFSTSLPFSEVTPINSVPKFTTHVESPSVLSEVVGPTISAPEESEKTLVPSASEAGSISSGSEESNIAKTAYPTITSDILSFSTAVASSYGSPIPSEEDDLPDCNESVTSSLTDADYISTTDKEIKTGCTELPSIRSASSVGYPSQYDAEFSNTEIIAPTTGPIAPSSSELSFSESAVESTPSTLASPSNSGSILTDYPTYTGFPTLSSPASVDNFPGGSVGLPSHVYPSEVITDLPASTGVPIFSSLSPIYDVSDSLIASSTETTPGDVVTELPTVTSLPLFSLSSATYRLGSESSTPGVDIQSSDGVESPLTSLSSLVLPSVSVETSSSIEVSLTIPTSEPIFVSPTVSLSQIPVPESTDTSPEGYPTTSLPVPESSISADASATSQYDNVPSPSILLPTSITTPLPSSSPATTPDLPTNSEFTSSTSSLPSSKSYTTSKPWISLPATKQPRPIGGVNPLSVFFAENIFPFKHGHYEKHKATTSLKSYISSTTKDAIKSPTSTVKSKKPIHNKEKRGRVVTTDLFTEDVVVAKTHSRTTIHVLTDFQTKTSSTKVSKATTD